MLGSVDEAGDDRLVLVDLMDRPLGSATKTEVHRRGLLHRAFSVLLWRNTEQGTEILLQKRAQGKYHSGGRWTNSCYSHPRYGEELGEAVARRLNEELGLPADAVSGTENHGAYVYRTAFAQDLIEYECDHVFLARCSGQPQADMAAAAELTGAPRRQARDELTSHPERFTSWFPGVLALAASHIA